MDVSIIIVAWNVRQLLHDCLKSVYEETKDIRFEVIYVDNASGDGSVEMVSEEFPKVRIIENKKNEGFIRANNQAIKIAQGRYVLLLNSDTIILDNAIAMMVKFADTHREAAVVGCKVVNLDKTLRKTCFMYPSLLNMFLSATYLFKIFPNAREVETVSGCCSLVRTQAIKQVGLMDETYFVYGDDADWCYRFSKKGWKILFTPGAEIIHYGGQTTKRIAMKFLLQLYGSKLIFMKLHRNRLRFPFACLLTALSFSLRSPYWLTKAILNKNERGNYISLAKTYLVGSLYCLTDWKKLLMNRKALKGRLKPEIIT
jgi:GT2 family glycosyltransferase